MSLERPIEKAKNATEKVVSDTKTLCPWLPDPPKCPHGLPKFTKKEFKTFMKQVENFEEPESVRDGIKRHLSEMQNKDNE